MVVIVVLIPHSAAITDSTTNEDSEDEDIPTTEDEGVSIITEVFSMVIKTVRTTVPIPTIIHLKPRNRPNESI